MKKIILIFSLMLIIFSIEAQTRTRTVKEIKQADNYYLFTSLGVADTLTAIDTLQFPLKLNKEYPVQYQITAIINKIALADTTIKMNIYGKMFLNDSWSYIGGTLSSAVNTNTSVSYNNIASQTSTIFYDTTLYNTGKNLYYSGTISTNTIASYYRYLMVEFTRSGEDFTGSGVKVTSFEVKLWRREF